MLDYINHVTYNSMDLNKTVPDDVDKKLYFILRNIVEESRKNAYVYPLDELAVQITEEDDIYVATIYYVYEENKIPVVITYGSKSDHGAKKIWQYAKEFYDKVFGGYDSTEKFQIGAPLILDIVIPAPVPLEIYAMTGDMSRCIGWMMLSPESVRG